jgi:nicotinamide mononucleotide transporter
MSQIFDWLFQQYEDTSTLFITLELIGVFFGFLSVWFSKQDNILVFPTGIISTAIFVYILLVNDLLGDMMINAYYFAMSVYGWFIWTRKVDDAHFIPITIMTKKETHCHLSIFQQMG